MKIGILHRSCVCFIYDFESFILSKYRLFPAIVRKYPSHKITQLERTLLSSTCTITRVLRKYNTAIGCVIFILYLNEVL